MGNKLSHTPRGSRSNSPTGSRPNSPTGSRSTTPTATDPKAKDICDTYSPSLVFIIRFAVDWIIKKEAGHGWSPSVDLDLSIDKRGNPGHLVSARANGKGLRDSRRSLDLFPLLLNEELEDIRTPDYLSLWEFVDETCKNPSSPTARRVWDHVLGRVDYGDRIISNIVAIRNQSDDCMLIRIELNLRDLMEDLNTDATT